MRSPPPASGVAASRSCELWLVPPLARKPVLAAMAVVAVVLTATSGGYGYHRDELYFRLLHPAWGYVDQPPLTPLLARLLTHVADEPWALRIPSTLSAVALVGVLALVTREAGGRRGPQALCAWGSAFAAFPLISGHVLLTASLDLAVWPAVLLFVIRAQVRRQPRWWLAAGLVVGLSTYNKLLVVVLLAAVAVGLAVVGPRPVLGSRWVLAASGIALVVGLPNIVYQATSGWPQLSMGRALADHNAAEVRITMWPFLAILLGPPLVPIWVAGLVGLIRRVEWRPIRFLAASFPALLALVWVMGSQPYYSFGLLAVLFALGCVPTWAWISRVAWRRALVVAAVALNGAVSALVALPLVPRSVLGDTLVPAINQVARDTVGWPEYVRQIAEVYQGLPPADRPQAVIVASNYGEAGAVDRYGPRYQLPRVYSGQNQLYFQARPPASATVAIVVGGQVRRAAALFRSCQTASGLENGLGVDNEEQGQPIAVCRDPLGGWTAVWPALRHLD